MNVKITTTRVDFSPGYVKNILLYFCMIFLFYTVGGSQSVYAASTGENYTQETISGTVMDQDGLPLPGVNVFIKGTQRWNTNRF